MDLKPFLELDLLSIKDSLVPELKRFCKANFNVEEIFTRASELKYTNEIKSYFTEQLREPDDEFVRFMCAHIYEGYKNAQVIERFRPIVKTALNHLINEMMNERITSALKTSEETVEPPPATEAANTEPEAESKSAIVTTEDEMQGFYIIRAILANEFDIEKITYKDTVHYFSVLYNDMPTRWICRLRINESKIVLSLPNDETRAEDRIELDTLNDIYKHKDRLLASARRFFNG
jgi:hypothetical protein